ncbi:hypothetical protein [Sedimentitalea todarodis]|uniref:Uncharacterized protein n=1 Tax=Sedimentitalea todarodis TaxID=1631240 RepID=A0ABU3VKX2_9RHOB|nr:hypothetical protein [Sedimentitalea todarodis]MDU9006833.1 hypothetical protein [Sedimentitalea todarodis]
MSPPVTPDGYLGDKTPQEIADMRKIHDAGVNMIRQANDGLTHVFSDKVRKAEDIEAGAIEPPAQIRKPVVENDFFAARVGAMSLSERKSMVKRDRPDLSRTKLCALPGAYSC